MTSSTRAVLLTAVAALTACTPDAPTAARPAADAAALAKVGDYSAWTTAVGIEQAWPGAHPEFNTPYLDGCPFIAPDDRTFYMASNRPGGLGGIDVWVSTRPSADAPWGKPANVGAPVNSSADDFCPTIARDGHTLYFVSRRQVGVQGVDWCGGSDMFVARLRDDRGFEGLEHLSCDVNSSADEFSPFPVEEPGSGPTLYFSSTRPGLGAGGDLYRSESHGGVYGPAALVPGVNGATDDGQPNVSRDALELYFYSNRSAPGAQGGNDIYVATRASARDPWSAPVNLGPNVNSPASETRPSLSWDGSRLYVGSNRAGSEPLNGVPSSDIYVTTRVRLAGRDR